MSEFLEFLRSLGITNIDWRNGIMLAVGLAFIFLAVSRNLEPYELLPIGLGIIIANLPLTGLTTAPTPTSGYQDSGVFGVVFH